jgi:hypothetical protein
MASVCSLLDFWSIIALLWTAATAVFAKAYVPETSLVTIASAGVLTGLGPLVIIPLSRSFQQSLDPLRSLLWNDESEFRSWVNHRERRIFGISHIFPISVIAAIFGGSWLTLLYYGLPVHGTIGTVLGVILSMPYLFTCGRGAYLVLALLLTLRELSNRPISSHASSSLHYETAALYDYYISWGLIASIGYIILAVGIWFSPYGLNTGMVYWLSFLGLYPLALFAWSTLRVHNIMKNAKVRVTDKTNEAARGVNDGSRCYSTLDDLYRLSAVHWRIQQQKEWPMDLQSVGPLLAAIGAALTQAIFAAIRGGTIWPL